MNDSVFIFLGSKVLDRSRQFENHQLRFIENLYASKIVDFKNVIVSAYVPEKIDNKSLSIIKQKIGKLEELADRFHFELEIICIKGKTLGSLVKALKQIREKASHFSRKVVFTQNYYSGFLGFFTKKALNNVYLHANLRGVPAEEELFYSRSFLFKRIMNFFILKWIERKLIPGSDTLSVVSRKYKKYLENKFKNRIKQVIVYPCAYESRFFYTDEKLRNEYRKKYNIMHYQKVFIYSGSMNKYQLPEMIFRFYENISIQDPEKKCVFVFLTLDKMEAEHLAESYLIHNLIIDSVYGKDLLGFYNAGDIGIIIRRIDLVNRISSPTKIPEYLATGNAVILTDGIGDYSSDLENKAFALIKKDVDDFLNSNICELMNLKAPDKNDLEWVREKYSSDKIKVFKEIFHNEGVNGRSKRQF